MSTKISKANTVLIKQPCLCKNNRLPRNKTAVNCNKPPIKSCMAYLLKLKAHSSMSWPHQKLLQVLFTSPKFTFCLFVFITDNTDA